MIDTDEIVKKALSMGVDEVSAIYTESDIKQTRFSNSKQDIYLNYIDSSLSLFISKNKKTIGSTIKDYKNIDEKISSLIKMMEHLPENQDFVGLNSKKQTYRDHVPDGSLENLDDLSFMTKRAIEGAEEKGAKRVAGTIYHVIEDISISTNYNSASDRTVGLFYSVRAFNENGYPGQAAFHTSDHKLLSDFDPYYIGQEAGDFASIVGMPKNGSEGKFDILFHPLCFGSLITYSVQMASAYLVDTGMSIFADKINKKIGSDIFTLYDDPTLESGTGFRLFDDEGTSTKKVTLIEKGVVKNILHNSSTAAKANTATTGNAGIISPQPWQPVMEKGRRSTDDIISDIKKGLYIINTWYTRFQDYRNGDFSTIPRDGIFYIEDGEIKESWQGIRISDNIPRIFSNISEVSNETMQVRWWDEVMPSVVPYVLVKDVNITKSK
ncbi:MAG: metallopeptidase TldD-related protein [Thermoplasmata archaeon]